MSTRQLHASFTIAREAFRRIREEVFAYYAGLDCDARKHLKRLDALVSSKPIRHLLDDTKDIAVGTQDSFLLQDYAVLHFGLGQIRRLLQDRGPLDSQALSCMGAILYIVEDDDIGAAGNFGRLFCTDRLTAQKH